MKFFARCIDSIERRPFIFGSFFIFFLIFSWFEQFLYTLYNSFLADKVKQMFSFIYDTGAQNTADIESAMNGAAVTGEVVPAGEIAVTILIVILLLFALSAILSVYFSGYFHILNISLKPNKEKADGEFRKGLVKHYFKFALYIFMNIIIFLAAAVGAVFALFPTILSFSMVSGGENGLLLGSIFLFLIAAIVVSFILAIILMYTTYMYPALINFKKGSFYMAKKVVNAKFWYILPRVMGFVILIGVWQWFMAHIGYGLVSFQGTVAAFIINAIFKTYVLFAFFFFIFFTFRQIKNALQAEDPNEESEEQLPSAVRSVKGGSIYSQNMQNASAVRRRPVQNDMQNTARIQSQRMTDSGEMPAQRNMRQRSPAEQRRPSQSQMRRPDDNKRYY